MENPKTSGLKALLCPGTLHSLGGEFSVPAREEIKELIGLPVAHKAPAQDARWRHLLDVIVQDFLTRRREVLRLDKSRRERIEQELRRASQCKNNLAEFLDAKMGTRENEALLLFAHEIALFHLMQLLLVKRLSDLRHLKAPSLDPSHGTANWLLTGYVKTRAGRIVQGKADWAFLKQNSFSWFTPSASSWERVRLSLDGVSLAEEETPEEILESVETTTRLGSARFPLDTAWRILLRARCQDSALDQLPQEPVLAFGAGIAKAALGLKKAMGRLTPPPLWLAPCSEMEQFLAEIALLWIAPGRIPPVRALSPICWKDSSLFQSLINSEERCHLVFCAPPADLALECLEKILGITSEHGLVLWSGHSYWPTDSEPSSQILRDAILRGCRLRVLVDLRHLHAPGFDLPRSLALFEKCSSKEIRDSHRPTLLRVKGTAKSSEDLGSLWEFLSGLFPVEAAPGELQNLPVPETSLRVEAMSAAAHQGQLRSAPWVSLAEPEFFRTVSVLRRTPERAYLCGHVLSRRQGDPEFSPSKGLSLKRTEGNRFLAESAGESLPERTDCLFVPDAGLQESPLYLSALFNSSPVQFWFKLEQEAEVSAGRSRAQRRQLEQLFKLLPVVRVLPRGVPLPSENPKKLPLQSLKDLREKSARLLHNPAEWSTADRVWLHDFAVQAETTVRYQLATARSCLAHLYPQRKLERWALPHKLPAPDPLHALTLLRHHSRAPALAHPLLHSVRLKPVSDFKITHAEEKPLPGHMAEVILRSGLDPHLRIAGPSFLVRAVTAECNRRSGRPWLEVGSRLLLPTDIGPVANQLAEFERITTQEISQLRALLVALDELFAGLFGLDPAADLEMIRRHLEPEESRVVDLALPSKEIRKGSETPTALLQ